MAGVAAGGRLVSAARDAIEAVIGLEAHVQLSTASKIFCSCATAHGAPPNTQVCPVCLGHPGVLPVLNREAVTMALRFGVVVDATIPPRNRFARKNYFYPDLPKGYQITQYEEPVLVGGTLAFTFGGAERRARLVRAHLEEDAGKLIHEAGPDAATWIDFNRAGVPLLEVVTEPDLRESAEAHAFLDELRRLVVALGICEGRMEEGNLRCDANVSVRRRGESALNPKTEIKNLNSFRAVERALDWEIARQAKALEAGEPLAAATRLWDEREGRTRVMRGKEEAEDYRYFPEPDLPPLAVDAAWVDAARASLPELPRARESRFAREYGVSGVDAATLTSSRELADYFDIVAREAGEGVGAAHWVLTEILRAAKESPAGLAGVRVDPRKLGKLVRMVGAGTLSGTAAKQVLAEMERAGGDPEALVKSLELSPLTDVAVIVRAALDAVASHPGPALDYLDGKTAVLQFFVGQVMRATGGRAEPRAVEEAVRAALEARR